MSPLEKAVLIVTVMTGTITVTTVAFRLAKTWFKFINDWEGTDLKPGVMERLEIGAGRFEYLEHKLDHLDKEISEIKAEFYTNGGSSLRDSINRIEDNINTPKKRPGSTKNK